MLSLNAQRFNQQQAERDPPFLVFQVETKFL